MILHLTLYYCPENSYILQKVNRYFNMSSFATSIANQFYSATITACVVQDGNYCLLYTSVTSI